MGINSMNNIYFIAYNILTWFFIAYILNFVKKRLILLLLPSIFQTTADKFVSIKPVHKYDKYGDTPLKKIDNTIYEVSITSRGEFADAKIDGNTLILTCALYNTDYTNVNGK